MPTLQIKDNINGVDATTQRVRAQVRMTYRIFRTIRVLSFYRLSYPHLCTSTTFQQPVSMQASYRFWQIRCVPHCDRA